MKNRDFYKLLDQDLATIINDFDQELTNKLKQDQQKKIICTPNLVFAFLFWPFRC